MLRRLVAALALEPRPIRFIASRFLMYTGLSRPIIIEKPGFRLRFYPTNNAAQQWVDPSYAYDKGHGYEEETFMRRYLRVGDVVIDVGANIGLTALAAFAAVGRAGEVHAFEPHPRIFRFLRGNVELNDAAEVVRTYHLALGTHPGKVFFTDQRADDQNAVASEATGLRVPMSTLDAVAADLARITLLKIDVEGYEKYVLEGAERTLPRVECVYFEAHPQKYAEQGCSVGDVFELLATHGLEVRRPDADRSRGVAAADVTGKPENLVAVRDVEEFHHRLSGLAL